MAKPKEPIRNASSRQDIGAIQAIKYNDAAGSDKVIIIEPVIKAAVGAGDNIGAGKYVKIIGTTYTLDLIGKAYSAISIYQKGDIVTNTTYIYMAEQDNITGAFDVTKWKKVADKSIGPITINAGAVVSTGRWHNCVTTAGWLVDDMSEIKHMRVRD